MPSLQSGTGDSTRKATMRAALDRPGLSAALEDVHEQLLAAYPTDFSQTDNQGGTITRNHIRRYLSSHAQHVADVIEQVRQLSPGTRVAEVGAAYGATLLALRALYGYDVHAFDLAENIPVYCRGLAYAGIHTEPWDLYDTDDVPAVQTFDFLICSEVVEHLHVSLRAVAKRLRSRLRVGGRLLLTTPNVYRMENVHALFYGANICEPHPDAPRWMDGRVADGREHPREYTVREVIRAFSEPRWRIRRIWTVGAAPQGPLRRRILSRLLEFYLPYPVGRTIFAVAERTG